MIEGFWVDPDRDYTAPLKHWHAVINEGLGPPARPFSTVCGKRVDMDFHSMSWDLAQDGPNSVRPHSKDNTVCGECLLRLGWFM